MLLVGFQLHSEMLLGIYTQQVLAGMMTTDIFASLALLSPLVLLIMPNWFFNKPKYPTTLASLFGVVTLLFRLFTPFRKTARDQG